MVILDTNIIIDHVRQPGKESCLTRFIKQFPTETLGMSIISIQELYEEKSTRDSEKEEILLTTISLAEIIPYTYEVAEMAGKISRESKLPVGFPDAAIAATTIINSAKLLTLNTKDFRGIGDLELVGELASN